MKKIIAFILAAVMAFSVLSVCGVAAETPAINNVYVEQKDLSADDADRKVNWYQANGEKTFTAKVIGSKQKTITLKMDALTDAEKQIILKGCLINYYKG